MNFGHSRSGILRVSANGAKSKPGPVKIFIQHILFTRSGVRRIRKFVTAACTIPLIAFTATPAQAASTVQFWATTTSVLEGDRAVLTVLRSGGLETPVNAGYSTSGKTALAGSDFLGTTGTLAFAAGESSRTIDVTILNDTIPEKVEQFQVTLSQPSTDAVLGAVKTVTVNIADNDRGVQIEKGFYSVTEDAGEIAVEIIRGLYENTPVSIDYATSDRTAISGRDYVATSGRLDFAAEEKRKIVRIPILNDAVRGAARSFQFTLSDPTGQTGLGQIKAATINIQDNDSGIAFAQASYTAYEDAGEAALTVMRGQDVETPSFTVDYATADVSARAGVDYLPVFGTLKFSVGEKSQRISVPIMNNRSRDALRTVRLTLTNPSAGRVLGSLNSTTLQIQDNDPGIGFESTKYTFLPGVEVATIPVWRGNDWALGPFTVEYTTTDGTAKAGVDYQAVSGRLEFQRNESVRNISVPLFPNDAASSSRILGITLSHVSGEGAPGLVTTSLEINQRNYAIASAQDSSLVITAAGSGTHGITWNGRGQLLRAEQPTGPWQRLSKAQSPITVRPTVPAGFYKVEGPRPASVYVPSAASNEALPLVMLLHGFGSTSSELEGVMKFGGLAESKKFLLCFPEGTKDRNGLQFWNASEACCDGFDTDVDDSGYLRGLIEVIGTRFPLDRKRVYAVGHSNGGFMAYRLACEHSDLIAAIASLMGMTTARPGGCFPSQPVNILHVHGSADSLVQYDGGLGLSFSWPTALSPFPGALESIALWAGYNGCADATTDTDASLKLDLTVGSALDTVVTQYAKSPPGGAVELWTIRGGEHRPTVSPVFVGSVVDWLLAHPKP